MHPVLLKKVCLKKGFSGTSTFSLLREQASHLVMSSSRLKHSRCTRMRAHPLRCWVPLIPTNARCLRSDGPSGSHPGRVPLQMRNNSLFLPFGGWRMQLFLWQPHYRTLISKNHVYTGGYSGYYNLLHVPGRCTLVLQVPLRLSLEEKIKEDRKSKQVEYLGGLDSKKFPVWSKPMLTNVFRHLTPKTIFQSHGFWYEWGKLYFCISRSTVVLWGKSAAAVIPSPAEMDFTRNNGNGSKLGLWKCASVCLMCRPCQETLCFGHSCRS